MVGASMDQELRTGGKFQMTLASDCMTFVRPAPFPWENAGKLVGFFFGFLVFFYPYYPSVRE